MEFRTQQLEEENGELKTINLEYQRIVRELVGKHRKLATENQQLKNENKELTERLNHLNQEMSYLVSRANQSTNIFSKASTGETDPSGASNQLSTADKAKSDELVFLEKKVERFKGMYQTWKEEFHKMEKEKLELERKYNELQSQTIKSLERDPRIKQKINSEKDQRIEELTRINTDLQARLHDDHEASSLDLTCVKLEKTVD